MKNKLLQLFKLYILKKKYIKNIYILMTEEMEKNINSENNIQYFADIILCSSS